MTNAEIIYNSCILYGIAEVVHTYAGWKARGYQVKKGSKALFKAPIWKHTTKKTKTEDGTETEAAKMFLTDAAFFGESQVEAIAKA